jgi:hypothetical protein
MLAPPNISSSLLLSHTHSLPKANTAYHQVLRDEVAALRQVLQPVHWCVFDAGAAHLE